MITSFEIIAVLTMIIIAIAVPKFGDRAFRIGARAFRNFARRRKTAIASVALLVLGVELILAVCVHWPQPAVHDEFAYLLSADTFAQGRLTNPTHPMWEHFDSYHIIQNPSYQAKYQPAQGVALAMGQVLFAAPIVGVWLTLSAACAAVCWMLYGWLPPRWALLGGLLAVLSPGVLVVWGQGFWGGGMPMLGGALVYGALPRIVRYQRARDAVFMAIGLLILANCRPYEGLVISIPAAIVLLVWILRHHRSQWTTDFRKTVLPIMAVLTCAGVWMGYYNYRVTGDPLRMPYQVWLEKRGYGLDRVVGLSRLDTPEPQKTAAVEEVDPAVQARMEQQRAAHLFSRRPVVKLFHYYVFYFRFALGISLLSLFWIVRRPWMRLAVVTAGLVLAVVVAEGTAAHAHYLAPATCLVAAIVVQGLRYIRQWTWKGRPTGLFLARAIPTVCAASMMFYLAVTFRSQPYPLWKDWSLERARILSDLEQGADRHLVVIRYQPDHIHHYEWVYNAADIDRAKVVWAHELDRTKNRDLLEYFRDRKVWLLQADVEPRKLIPVQNPFVMPRDGTRIASH